MKQKLIPLVSIAIILVEVALGAQKFWEKKEFPDWNKKETQKMLKKSPWARAVPVRLNQNLQAFVLANSRGMSGVSASSRGSTAERGVAFGNPGGGGDPRSHSGAPPSRRGSPSGLSVTVRWCSSLPIKHAFATHRYGSEAHADKELLIEENHYMIGLSGLIGLFFIDEPDISKSEANLDPWAALNERLSSHSFLKIPGRSPIQTVEIQMRRAPHLDEVDVAPSLLPQQIELLILFPRTQPITLEEREVEFVTKVAGKNLKKKFKLKDMVYHGKLEL
jgi:hypothetical protein